MAAWEASDFGTRLWAKDPTLWFPLERPEITNRLGWLDLPELMSKRADELVGFAGSVGELGHVVLLGMGGSSLAPEVFQRTLGGGEPELIVLDSTHPDAIRSVADTIDPARTLFLVSSKSGTTLETLSFFRFFWALTGGDGSRFAAITDPGSSLQALAEERGFRAVFEAPADVGGRYSALSVFGLVPAALIGADIHRILASAMSMATATSAETPVGDNPALRHGAVLGEFAVAGFDKLTYLVSTSLASFPGWLEQLVAESTGKEGKGIVPVAAEPPGDPSVYGSDRLFVSYEHAGDDLSELHETIEALERAGRTVVRFPMDDLHELGAEMFRAEMAVAAAGSVLGIHPFDQPDVQLAKELAIRAMAGEDFGEPVTEWGVDDLQRIDGGSVGPGDYFSIQAFVPPTPSTLETLQRIRVALRDRVGSHLATTLGFGPRFLHSTGQLHKGGPDGISVLQLVDEPTKDLAVPETDYTFGDLIRAQSLGDAHALTGRGRRLVRINLGDDTSAGLNSLLAHVVRRS
jgi:transaldolase/glucose-6-phosphate isomerase